MTNSRIARAQDCLELVLPWPSRSLHPNARVHWSTRAKVAKQARASACALALIKGWRKAKLPEGRLHLWLTFYPPNRHKHDDDGCLSAFKPHRDGLADALKMLGNAVVPIVVRDVIQALQVAA